jgi:hypothetical protein
VTTLTRLSEIKPGELSLVRRGAVRRPWLFVKAEDDWVDVSTRDGVRAMRSCVIKALTEPADGELEFLKEQLGDEAEPEAIALAAAQYRIAKSAGIDPTPLRPRTPKPVRVAPPAPAPRHRDPGVAAAAKNEARAAEIRKADDSLTVEQSLAAAYRELDTDELESLRAHLREQHVEKADTRTTPTVPVAIEKAADQIMERRGSRVTREQAIAQVCRENPELAEAWRRQ